MNRFTETLEVAGGTLHVVPAVHFKTPFAERVNQLCRNEGSRPKAIAIELGPGLAQYVYQWFLELHKAGRLGREFPCMLAITAPNRRIRPSMKQRAISLQEETGSNLEELSQDILNKVLGYSSESVLFLSPADSIVEAIRSAVELGIPVYGVDLEEVADSERQEVLIRDTGDITAQDVPAWIGENLDCADWCRDEAIDERREIAMAARLKTIVKKHDNVLFTCGVAHWHRIQKLLQDEVIKPAIVDCGGTTEPREYVRLIVHPSLAIYFLDPFPPWVENVEKLRDSADRESRDGDVVRGETITQKKMFQGLIKLAYEVFLRQSLASTRKTPSEGQGSYAIHDFTTLLENLSLLENRVVPDLFSMFSAARGTVSLDFQEVLAEKFFRYDWVDPEELGLPILFSIEREFNTRMKVQVMDVNGKTGRHFFLNNLPGYGESKCRGKVPCPKDIESKYSPDERHKPDQLPERMQGKKPETPDSEPKLRTWNPTDNLFALMCCRAMKLAKYIMEQKVSLPFEGSFYDGLCIKSMVRAAAVGDERVYVKQKKRLRGQPEIFERMLEPIVWLFDTNATSADWTAYTESLYKLKEHCKARNVDARKLDSIAQKLGSKYIAGMTYGSSESCASHYQRMGIEMKFQLAGVIYFIPPICNESEDLEWMRQGDFLNLPIVPESDIGALVKVYHDRYKIELKPEDWISTMIGLAIPFARSNVVVVAPRGFTPSLSLVRAAGKLGKNIALVPLSHFSDSVIKLLQKNYGVYRQETPLGDIFNPLAIRMLGKEPDSYRNQVPDWLCDRVGRNRKRVSG